MAISSDAIGLLFRARGDTDEARDAYKKLRDDIVKHSKDIEGGGTTAFIKLGQSIGLTEGQITKLGAALPIVGGIIAAAGAAAVGAAAGMFELAKGAADYGSKIHDAAQQTGLSTQTISALKYAADESGSSLEAITGSVAKFSALLGEAKNGNEKAIGTLKQYGITSTDTDGALKQAIKTIAEMTDHDKQAAAAKDLFRERTAAILPVIQSFDGDLPGLIKHLEDMGLVMSQDDADAADKFGDQMDDLSKQLTGVKVKIGTELMPVFQDMAKQFSDWLADNKGEVKSWGDFLGKTLEYIANAFKIFITDIQIADEWSSHFFNTDKYYQLLDKLAVLEQKDNDFFNGNYIPVSKRGGNVNDQVDELKAGPPKPQPTIVDAEAAKKAKEEAEKQQRERLQSLSEYYRKVIETTKQAYEETKQIQEQNFKDGLTSEETYRKNLDAARTKAFNETKQKIELQANAEKELAKNDIERKTADVNKENALTALKIALKKDELKVDEDISQRHDEIAAAEKRVSELEARYAREQLDRQRGLSEAIKNLINDYQELGDTIASVIDRVNQKLEYWKNLNQEAANLVRANVLALRDLQDKRAEGQRDSLITQVQRSVGSARIEALKQLRDFDIAEAKRHEQQRQDDLNAEEAAALESVKESADKQEQILLIEDLYHKKRLLSEAEFLEELRKINKQFQEDSGGGGLFDGWLASWDQFFSTIQSQVGTVHNSLLTLAESLQHAFLDVARAIGSVIQQWIIYGTTGPAVMRKVLAAALASIAAEAAVRAIEAAALGFLLLAMGDFEAAGNAFVSAGMWALLAGAAALAGRAVAGNAFKQQNQGAYGGAAAGGTAPAGQGTGGLYSSQPDVTKDVDRNSPGSTGTIAPIPVAVHLKLDLDSNGVIRVVADNYKNNGLLRSVMVTGS